MNSKNGLEKKLTRFIEEQKKINASLDKLLKQEFKLKAVMFEWLKDHHVRLGRHWSELVHRTAK